jgi:hypothetical protein
MGTHAAPQAIRCDASWRLLFRNSQGITMKRNKRAPAYRRIGACVLVFSLSATAAPAGGGFVMRQSLVANGGGFVSDGCYRLFSAIGQAVIGSGSAGEFTLSSGFLVDVPSTEDKLFRSGFETSTGACK